MQQGYYRKHAIDKNITETQKNKRKTITVGLTTKNQSVFEATIMGFMNVQ